MEGEGGRGRDQETCPTVQQHQAQLDQQHPPESGECVRPAVLGGGGAVQDQGGGQTDQSHQRQHYSWTEQTQGGGAGWVGPTGAGWGGELRPRHSRVKERGDKT